MNNFDLDDIAQKLADYHDVNVTCEMLEEFSETQQDLFLYGYENMLTYDVWQESLEAVGEALAEKVAADFFNTFRWDVIEEQFKTAKSQEWPEFENPVKALWIGSWRACTPTGKFYTPFANSNVTWFGALCDEIFQEKLEEHRVGEAYTYWNDGELFLIQELEPAEA